MNGCVHRNQFNFCSYYSHDDVISFCDIENCEEIKPSNGDMIRAMSDEELAVFIGNLVDHFGCEEKGCLIKQTGNCGYPKLGCDESALQWLEQEAEHE